MTIWANTLVQNEEKYLWYAVTSVVDYVDRLLIWDTGSTDNTLVIINELKKHWPDKIDFKEVGEVVPEKFTAVRNEMLKASKSDWVFILDGDEVWWDDSVKKLVSVIKRKSGKIESIVSRYINLVGDIYHYQDESAGRYNIKGTVGFLTIRAMNKNMIEGLMVDKPHGQQGFFDGQGNLIQDRPETNMYFMKDPSYLHFTNLPRSGDRKSDLRVPKRGFKLKHEVGVSFELDYYYPETFFRPHPEIVEPVWKTMDKKFFTRSLLETPLRKIKRKTFKGKSGY